MSDERAAETYTVAEVLQRALGDHRAGRLAAAQRLYRKILRSVPAHPDAMHLLGLSEHHCGRHEKGVRMIERALQQRPDVAAYHNTLADCYRWLGQQEPAITHYREAIRLAPESARPHYNLAVVCRQAGQTAEADEALRRAVQLDPALQQATPGGGPADRAAELAHATEVSQRLALLTATQELGRLGGREGSAEIRGQGGVNVIQLDGLHLPPDGVLTLRGGPQEVLVVNVRTHFALDENARVELAGGLAASGVLWNFPAGGEGLGSEIRGGPGSVLQGTLLAPDRIVFWFGTIHGGLIAATNAGGPATVHVEPFAAPPPAAAAPDSRAAAVDTLLSASDEQIFDEVDDMFAELGTDETLKLGSDEGIRTWAEEEHADAGEGEEKRKEDDAAEDIFGPDADWSDLDL